MNQKMKRKRCRLNAPMFQRFRILLFIHAFIIYIFCFVGQVFSVLLLQYITKVLGRQTRQYCHKSERLFHLYYFKIMNNSKLDILRQASSLDVKICKRYHLLKMVCPQSSWGYDFWTLHGILNEVQKNNRIYSKQLVKTFTCFDCIVHEKRICFQNRYFS